MQTRKAAQGAFVFLDSSSRIRKAILSGPRADRQFRAGEMVYFWRRDADVQAFRVEHVHAHWHGPAIVVGHHRAKIWVSFRGHLWLCSPEQVRLASAEESASQTLPVSELLETARNISDPNFRYQASTECPEPETSARQVVSADVDMPPPAQPVDEETRMRRIPQTPVSSAVVRGRSVERSRVPGTPVLNRSRSRMRPESGSEVSLFAHGADDGSDDLQVSLDSYGGLFAMDYDSHDKVEWLSFMAESSSARKRKELIYHRMSSADQTRFESAMLAEWKTNILRPEASELLSLTESREIRECPQRSKRIVPTCWVLVEKDMGLDLETQAKARMVVQGFRDPDLGDIEISSPTLHKDSLLVILQMMATFKWTLILADIKGAFMSSRPLQRDQGSLLAALPKLWLHPEEADAQQLLRIKVAWCGLNDGPREFYNTLGAELSQLGCARSPLDPCVYVWHCDGRPSGVIGVTVDDLCCGGSSAFREQVLEPLCQRFTFGKICEKQGRFTGRDLCQAEDFSISIDQVEYINNLKLAEVPRSRRRDRESPLSDQERTLLRIKAGELNWVQAISRPDLAGAVSLLQTSFAEPKVAHLLEANKLLKEAKDYPVRLRVRHIPLQKLMFVCSADATWATCSDLASHMGYFYLCSRQRLGFGEASADIPDRLESS